MKDKSGNIFIGKVWPGLTAFPDFLNSKAAGYWEEQVGVVHRHAYMYVYIHTCTHTHARTHARTHTHTCTNAHTHTRAQAHTHACTHAHTQTCMHTRACTRTHTHLTSLPSSLSLHSTTFLKIGNFLNLLPVDGLWFDMNEISNFCNGACQSEEELLGGRGGVGFDPNNPPYQINNLGGKAPLNSKTTDMDCEHSGGVLEYNAHNFFGELVRL